MTDKLHVPTVMHNGRLHADWMGKLVDISGLPPVPGRRRKGVVDESDAILEVTDRGV